MAAAGIPESSRDEVVKIGKAGGSFTSKVDKRIRVEFPRGALDATHTFRFMFEKINVRRFTVYSKLRKDISDVAGFSGVLHVTNKMPKIPGTVVLTLPLLHDTKDGEDDDFEVIFCRMKDYMDRPIERPIKHPRGNYYQVNLNDFSVLKDNFSAWKVSKGVPMNKIMTVAKFLIGELSLCTLLTFMRYHEHEPWIILNVVDVVNIENVVESYLAQGFVEVINSRSKNFTMTNDTRIDVKLEQNIRPAHVDDRSHVEDGLTFRVSEISNGIQFPFRMLHGPEVDCSVYFEGENVQHAVSFNLSAYKPALESEGVDDEVISSDSDSSDCDDIMSDLKHVGEGVYAEVHNDEPHPSIEVKPSATRSDVIDKTKKDSIIMSEVLDLINEPGFSHDLHIPVNLPETKLHPRELYDFFVVNQWGDKKIRTEIKKWPKQVRQQATTPYKVKARIGNWTSFSVIARKKKEKVKVTPREGAHFISKIDKNVILEVPKDAISVERELEIKLNEIDQQVIKGYKSQSPEVFGVIKNMTSGIDVRSKPGVEKMTGLVKITLPIRDDLEADDSETEVVLIRCDEDHMEEIPVERAETKNYYIAQTRPFDRAFLTRRDKNDFMKTATKKTLKAIRYLNGENNLCTIMTFVNFDNGKDLPVLRVECTYNFKANAVADKHRKDNFTEMPKSRSSERIVKDKERISIFLTGNLKIPPHIPKSHYQLTFLQQSSSNHTDVPIMKKSVTMGNTYSILEYSGNKGCTMHAIHFIFNSRWIENLLLSSKAQMDQLGNGILSEASLAVLGEQLNWRDWERVGIEVGVSQEVLNNIRSKEEAHCRPLHLLKHWFGKTEGDEIQMAKMLADAIDEIGKSDIASVITKAIDDGGRLRRKDFK